MQSTKSTKSTKSTRYIAVVEDEREASDLLIGCIRRYAEEKGLDLQVRRFFDAASFFGARGTDFDIIFLDIMLPDGNGMEIAAKIRTYDKKSLLIFVTNLAQYAIGGYEVGAFDFILKPVNYDSFVFKFDRAYAVAEQNRETTITVRSGNNEVRVLEVSQVRYIEVDDHSIAVHMKEEIIRTSGRLADFYERLKDLAFALCNQCYLVNMRHITGIRDDCVCIGGEELRISRPRKKAFLKEFNDYLGT